RAVTPQQREEGRLVVPDEELLEQFPVGKRSRPLVLDDAAESFRNAAGRALGHPVAPGAEMGLLSIVPRAPGKSRTFLVARAAPACRGQAPSRGGRSVKSKVGSGGCHGRGVSSWRRRARWAGPARWGAAAPEARTAPQRARL